MVFLPMRSFLFAVILAACGSSATAPALGEDTELRLGAAVAIPSDTTLVRFADVTSDSRCPTGAQCIWAGEAVATFVVGGNEPITLTLGADAAKARVIVRGYQMTLVALKPHPNVNQAIVKSDYVATVRFTSAKD